MDGGAGADGLTRHRCEMRGGGLRGSQSTDFLLKIFIVIIIYSDTYLCKNIIIQTLFGLNHGSLLF